MDSLERRTELEPGFDRANERGVFAARITIGFAQGIILYALSRALAPSSVDPISYVLYGLMMAAVFVPPFIELGVGTLRARPLILWGASAAAVTAALGAYARIRQAPDHPQLSAEFMLLCILVPGLFVATVLVTDSLVERRLFPSYQRHFETAWKYGIQLAMAQAFVLLFEGILQLGAALFGMIGIHAFGTIISDRAFWMPATATAGAFAIHATDTAPRVLHGARSLALTLCSLLLPLFALIIAGFLGRVLFASLTPLWALEYPTGVLLAAAGLLVFFINCQYQDGSEPASGRLIRTAACALAIIELVGLVVLAVWALGGRVAHYGWTVNRIFVAATIVIAASYASGYFVALIRSWKRPRGIEMTNVGAAYLFLAVILLLSSPVADPARLMVASQVARLTSGTVGPERFDYGVLREEGERWGLGALARLAATYDGPVAAFVRRKAAAELAKRPGYLPTAKAVVSLSREEVLQRIRLFPKGANLPDDFITQIGRSENTPLHCLKSNGVLCLARSIPSPSDSTSFLLLLDLDDTGSIDLFRRNARGVWKFEGSNSDWRFEQGRCRDLLQRGLEANTLRLAPHAQPDVVLGNHRLTIDSQRNNNGSDCASR